jgi:hypothetical protein
MAFEVTRYGIDDLDRAIADSAAHGWVKVLTVPGKDRILGVTIVGAHAGDLLAEYVLAMKHGLGLNKILGTIHTYPTLAEANKYAAGEWKRAHQPLGLLRWVERFHAWRRGLGAGPASAAAGRAAASPCPRCCWPRPRPWCRRSTRGGRCRRAGAWRGLPQQKPPLTRYAPCGRRPRRAAVEAEGRTATWCSTRRAGGAARCRGPGGWSSPTRPPTCAPSRRRHRRPRLPELRAAAGAGALRRTTAAARGARPQRRALPAATLCWVWGTHAAGSLIDNAYSRRVRYLVLRTQADGTGRWLDERATWRPTSAAPSATRAPSRRRWRR